MRPAQREECTFPWSNLEYVVTDIHIEFPIKNVNELMLAGVNMRRGSVPLLILESTRSKAPPVSSTVASSVLRMPLYQVDISTEVHV
jgi:hypothetical protein